MPNQSLLEEQAQGIEELVELEAAGLTRELSAEERARWRSLCVQLFGDSPDDDRRRFFRIKTQRSARIVAPEEEEGVEVTSLSAGGLFLYARQASPDLVGKDIEVELELPTQVPNVVQCRARVCWVGAGEDPRKRGMGVRFVDLDAEQKRQVLEHCRQHLKWLLELSEHKYHFFFEHSADVAVLLDPTGVIREINQRGAEIVGRAVEQIIGTHIGELVAPESREQLLEALARIGELERTRLPAHFRLASGRTLPVDVHLVSLTVAGLAVGAILVAHDIIARQRVAEQQRELERRLFQADKLATIGQIAASVAHDINNPLAYMHSNLALLSDYFDPIRRAIHLAQESPLCTAEDATLFADIDAELSEIIEDTLEGCRRIRDILRELHDFSRVDGGGKVRIDVNKAVETSLRVVKNLIKHRAGLVRDFAPDIPPTYGNFGRLSQVLLNLLSNAAYAFAVPDIERNQIRVSTSVKDDQITISVSDNGPGIPEDTLPHIFEPFFTTRRETGGTGLGLAIARENVEALDGELAVQSTVGVGSTFTVVLPAKPPSRPWSGPPEHKALGRAGSCKLLVVDDEPALLRSIKRVLEPGYHVMLASSPTAALELATLHDFALVLCDVMIPEMDGLRFRDALVRVRPELGRRLVFMTGGTFTTEEELELARSGRPVLHKPIEPEVLIRVVANVVSMSDDGIPPDSSRG